MLEEWLTHLTTPCKQPYKQLGYLGELIAIRHRHRRCKAAWQPHLDTCKKRITSAVKEIKNTDKVVVLGSGLLLDIPIDHLSKRFKTVVLVDICHLRETRKIAKTYPNIKFVEADISGIIDALLCWNSGTELPEPNIKASFLKNADYVISANLLAQLPLTPLTYLEKIAPDLENEQRQNLATRIIRHHLEMLKGLACPVTLISETKHIISNGGQDLHESAPLYGHKFQNIKQEWVWDLAPRPEMSREYDLKLRVAEITDL